MPAEVKLPVQYRLVVDVLRFEAESDGQALLKARWALIDPSAEVALAMRESSFRQPFAKADPDAQVAALSATLGDLSREVAETIRRPTLTWAALRVSVSGRKNIYGPPRDARGKSLLCRRRRCGHISGIVVRYRDRSSCPDGIREPSRPHHIISLGDAGLCVTQGFGKAGRAFHAITVMFTLRNAW